MVILAFLLLCLRLPSVLCYVDNDDYIIYGYEEDENGESHNMVQDWSMEMEEEEGSYENWWGRGATITKTQEASHTGEWSLKTSNRGSKFQGAYTWVYNNDEGTLIKPDTMYYLSANIRLINNSTKSTYTLIRLFYEYKTDTGKAYKRDAARLTFQLANGRWKQIGGDMKTPADYAVDYLEIRVHVEPEDVEYYIDSVAMTEMEEFGDWRSVLQTKVEKARMSDLDVRTVLPAGTSLSDTEVTVEMLRHHVGFGTAIKNHVFLTNEKYRNFILKYFNQAVAENDFKWSVMSRRKNEKLDFEAMDEGLAILLDNDFIVRGHNLVWEEKKKNPGWVQSITDGEAMHDEIWARVKYMMEHFKGLIDEWDVCNEYLQYHFYEDITGDLNLLYEEFQEAHRIDPDTKLCLSDYLIARQGWFASAQKELALQMLADGQPVGCVGVQSHLRTLPIVPEVLYKRIKIVAQAGLDISITELSVHAEDVEERREALEKALYVYYSIPETNIVNLWGFSDQEFAFDPNSTALTTGPDFIPNAAGQAYMDLIHKKWHTKETYSPEAIDSTKSIRAYHGKYRITVKINGEVQASELFDVNKGDSTASVTIEV